jgi:hypothetical protein
MDLEDFAAVPTVGEILSLLDGGVWVTTILIGSDPFWCLVWTLLLIGEKGMDGSFASFRIASPEHGYPELTVLRVPVHATSLK